MANESIHEFVQHEFIDNNLADKLYSLPDGTLFTKLSKFYNKYHWLLPSIVVGLSSVMIIYNISQILISR